MRVTCPSCANVYTMPESLMGPAGARVVCPTCWYSFVVDADREAALPPAVRLVPRPPALRMPAPASRAGALQRLRALDDRPGSLAAAALRGRLFSQHGPAIAAAFAAWRDDEGHGAPAAEFRRALEAVTGMPLAAAAASPDPAAGDPAAGDPTGPDRIDAAAVAPRDVAGAQPR